MVFPRHSLPKLLPALVFLLGAQAFSAPPQSPNPEPAKASATPAAGEPGTTAVLYVPGAYQGYKPATAPMLNGVAGSPGLFEGYIDFVGSGVQGFKFTDAPDWDHTNYGDGGAGRLNPDGTASDLTVPSEGYYEMTVDLNKKTWAATKTTWSVIGDATPGGWEKDTPMTYDPDKQVWTVTAPMKTAGSFKFRANDAWKIDFGLDSEGKLQYADNPFFGYNASIKDLTVPDDGTYTITLDLHVSGQYTYHVEVK
jgi:hypothetical protein